MLTNGWKRWMAAALVACAGVAGAAVLPAGTRAHALTGSGSMNVMAAAARDEPMSGSCGAAPGTTPFRPSTLENTPVLFRLEDAAVDGTPLTAFVTAPATGRGVLYQVQADDKTPNQTAQIMPGAGFIQVANADRYVYYVPPANSNGLPLTSINYYLQDSCGNVSSPPPSAGGQIVFIDVQPVNQPPTATPTTVVGAQYIDPTGFTPQTADVDGDPLTLRFTALPTSGTVTRTDGTPVTLNTPYSLGDNLMFLYHSGGSSLPCTAVLPTGSVTYSYTVSDPGGLSASATDTIDITPQPQPPSPTGPASERVALNSTSGVSFQLTADDPAQAGVDFVIDSVPQHGQLLFSAAGNLFPITNAKLPFLLPAAAGMGSGVVSRDMLVYIPALGFTSDGGSPDSFTYRVRSLNNAYSRCGEQTLSLYVDPPVSRSLSTVTVDTTSVPEPTSSSALITVTLKDVNGNPISGKTVGLRGTGRSQVLNIGTTSDANGIVRFRVRGVAPGPVTYTASDTTDNITLPQTVTVTFVPADTTPPVLAVTAAIPDGKGGTAGYSAGTWTNQPVTVTFTCTDGAGGSGVASDPSFSKVISAETAGTTVKSSDLEACADKANNVATPLSFGPIQIDRTAPTTGATAKPQLNGGWAGGPVTVALSATDGGGSGVKSLSYSAAGAQTIALTTANSSTATINITAPGQTTLSFFATDNAGNVEQTKMFVAGIDATPPSCGSPTVGYASSGAKQLSVPVQDGGSGLTSVTVSSLANATIAVVDKTTNASYASGVAAAGTAIATSNAIDQLTVTAMKVDNSRGASIALHLVDTAGNTTDCGSLVTTVVGDGGEGSQSFNHIPIGESELTLVNGSPGVERVKVTVDGKSLEVKDLKAGEQRSVDVASLMKRGQNNRITLTAHGKKGSSIDVIIADR